MAKTDPTFLPEEILVIRTLTSPLHSILAKVSLLTEATPKIITVDPTTTVVKALKWIKIKDTKEITELLTTETSVEAEEVKTKVKDMKTKKVEETTM